VSDNAAPHSNSPNPIHDSERASPPVVARLALGRVVVTPATCVAAVVVVWSVVSLRTTAVVVVVDVVVVELVVVIVGPLTNPTS
jgi:hypothetical protein